MHTRLADAAGASRRCIHVFLTIAALALASPLRAWAQEAWLDMGNSGAPCSLHPAFLARIHKDLEWLDRAGGITDAMIRNVSHVCDVNIRHQCNARVVRMMIKDGELYLTSLHPHWRLGPPELIGFLLELYEASKLYKLPDVEFAYNGDDDACSPAFDWRRDAPGQTVFHGGPFPLLAWSKSNSSSAILVPYSGAFRCTADSFDALLARLEDVSRVPWAERRAVAFGRWNLFCPLYTYRMPQLPSGETYVCPRSYLPRLSPRWPGLLDVHFLGEPNMSMVPLLHQNQFRYLVSTDGWAISSKFDKYLLLGSTVLRAHSSRFGYYYDAIRDGEHYVLIFNKALNDVVNATLWLRENDELAASIAANARAFAVRHLHRGARLCYYRALMEELGKRMRYTPDCSQRKLCIPVGRFLEFLTTRPSTARSCRYQEVLLRHGVNRSLDFPPPKQMEALLAQDKLWPRDTDVPPLKNEPYFPGDD